MSILKNYLAQFKNDHPMHVKGIDLLCHLFFAIWLIFAILFFKERILPYDGSYYMFNIVNFKDFFMPHGRWGVALSQLPALIAVYLKCSLKTIVTVYSASNVVYNYCFYLIIRYLFKNVKIAIALTISLCLCCRYMFYFVPSDINPGFGPAFLLAALLSASNGSAFSFKNLLIFFLNLWLIFIHPIYVFVAVFLYGSFIVNRKFKANSSVWFGIITLALVFIFKLLLIKGNSYEANKIPSVSVIMSQLPKIHTLTSFTFFIFFSLKHYVSAYIISAFTVLILIVRKQWRELSFFAGYTFAFIVLVILTYYEGESPIMHETYYVLCGVFIVLAFVTFAFDAVHVKFKAVLLFLILAFNTKAIYDCKTQISSRFNFMDYIETQQSKLKTNKFILSKANFDNDVIWSDWNLGLESLLYSSLKNSGEVFTVTSVFSEEQKQSMLSNSSYLAGPHFEGLHYSSANLNPDYFNLQFNSTYKYLSLDKEPKLLSGITISFVSDTLQAKIDGSYMNKLQFEFRVTNNSSDTLFSTRNYDGFYEFDYKIMDETGKMLSIKNTVSPLLCDLYPNSSEIMPISIKLPYKKRHYKIVAVLKYKSNNIALSKPTTIKVN